MSPTCSKLSYLLGVMAGLLIKKTAAISTTCNGSFKLIKSFINLLTIGWKTTMRNSYECDLQLEVTMAALGQSMQDSMHGTGEVVGIKNINKEQQKDNVYTFSAH